MEWPITWIIVAVCESYPLAPAPQGNCICSTASAAAQPELSLSVLPANKQLERTASHYQSSAITDEQAKPSSCSEGADESAAAGPSSGLSSISAPALQTALWEGSLS